MQRPPSNRDKRRNWQAWEGLAANRNNCRNVMVDSGGFGYARSRRARIRAARPSFFELAHVPRG